MSSPWWRPVWVTLTVVGAVYTMIAILLDTSAFAGYDIAAYWALEPTDPYRVRVAPALGAFLYSPPIAWLFAPVGLLDLASARVIWLAMEVGILAVLGGPLTMLAAFIPPLRNELVVGNISLPMAACLVLGLRRWPAFWAFPILAKVTPVVGLAWFIGRRDWRGLTRAGGVTLLLIGLTYLLAPGLWGEWVSLLLANSGVATEVDLGPLWLRAPLAVMICWWAGRTNRAWLVPIAVAFSLGHVWVSSLSIMVASIPLFWSSVDADRLREHGDGAVVREAAGGSPGMGA